MSTKLILETDQAYVKVGGYDKEGEKLELGFIIVLLTVKISTKPSVFSA